MKTAAAMADAGEVRILVEGIWNREELENAAEDPMEKVNRRVTRHHACLCSSSSGSQNAHRQNQ